jgi:hypothetical protein
MQADASVTISAERDIPQCRRSLTSKPVMPASGSSGARRSTIRLTVQKLAADRDRQKGRRSQVLAKLLEFERIDVISDEMRALVEDECEAAELNARDEGLPGAGR